MLNKSPGNNEPVRFSIIFLVLFLLFYYFNIMFFSLTSKGHNYSAFLDNHLNYISGLRWLLLTCSAKVLSWLGYIVITSEFQLLVMGHGAIQLVYTCLGLGILSFFCAFVLAYPKPWKQKLIFLITGIIVIELLNILRFVLLALYWKNQSPNIPDHHTIFNIIIYVLIAVSLYIWINRNDNNKGIHATN